MIPPFLPDETNRRPAATGCGPSVLCFTSVRLCFYAAQARSFHRKVTIWARVQWASGLKVLALKPRHGEPLDQSAADCIITQLMDVAEHLD